MVINLALLVVLVLTMQAAIFAVVRETLKEQRRVIMYVSMWSVDSFILGQA